MPWSSLAVPAGLPVVAAVAVALAARGVPIVAAGLLIVIGTAVPFAGRGTAVSAAGPIVGEASTAPVLCGSVSCSVSRSTASSIYRTRRDFKRLRRGTEKLDGSSGLSYTLHVKTVFLCCEISVK